MEMWKTIFTSTWKLLTTVEVPGIGVTFGAMFISIAVIGIGMQLLFISFGVGGNSGTGYRVGGRSKAKISSNRRGDEK